jgi:hypothetical protein
MPSPDDQSGDGAEEIQAVAGADPLALDVDHRAERLQEGLARARPLKWLERSRDRLKVDALPGAALAHPLAELRHQRSHTRVGGEPQ